VLVGLNCAIEETLRYTDVVAANHQPDLAFPRLSARQSTEQKTARYTSANPGSHLFISSAMLVLGPLKKVELSLFLSCVSLSNRNKGTNPPGFHAFAGWEKGVI
jgi:hypothetical protein